ncbi:MAG: hypothetical protein ABSF09_12845 [Candidatus Bathyarchaeia archaeon]
MSRKQRTKTIKYIKYLLILVVTVLWLFPVYWLVVTAFKTRLDMFAIPPKWFNFQPIQPS